MNRRSLVRHVPFAAAAALCAACAPRAPGTGSVTPLGRASGGAAQVFPPITLPTPETPRADGKLTLLWFRALDCPRCERMSDFATATFDRYAARLVQVDADVYDQEKLARRFRVPGTPTFVLLDPAGKELTRFFYEPNPERLEARFVKFLPN